MLSVGCSKEVIKWLTAALETITEVFIQLKLGLNDLDKMPNYKPINKNCLIKFAKWQKLHFIDVKQIEMFKRQIITDSWIHRIGYNTMFRLHQIIFLW